MLVYARALIASDRTRLLLRAGPPVAFCALVFYNQIRLTHLFPVTTPIPAGIVGTLGALLLLVHAVVVLILAGMAYTLSRVLDGPKGDINLRAILSALCLAHLPLALWALGAAIRIGGLGVAPTLELLVNTAGQISATRAPVYAVGVCWAVISLSDEARVSVTRAARTLLPAAAVLVGVLKLVDRLARPIW